MDVIISLFALIGIGAVLYFCWRLFIWKKQEVTDIVMDRNISEILQRKKHEELEKLWDSNGLTTKEREEKAARRKKWALIFKQLSTEDKDFLAYLYLIIHCCDVGCETVLVIDKKDMINEKDFLIRMLDFNKKFNEEAFYCIVENEETISFQMEEPELYDEMRDYARANKYEIKI